MVLFISDSSEDEQHGVFHLFLFFFCFGLVCISFCESIVLKVCIFVEYIVENCDIQKGLLGGWVFFKKVEGVRVFSC